jgi:hypothetical protein
MAGIVRGELDGRPIMLENAATEATLEALLKATLANSSNKSQAAKIQKAYEDALKRTTKDQEKNLDVMKKQKKAIEDENNERESLNKTIREEKAKREKLFQNLQDVGQLLGKSFDTIFSTATPKVSDFTNALGGIPIIGPIIGALGNAMQGQIDKFRELSQVGADFGGGIDQVREEARNAGLSLDTFTSAITSNSKDLALLGGSTSGGAKIFSEVNKSLKGPFQQSLARLGFSMEETAEYTAGYLAQQTRLGHAQRMTQTQLNKGAQDYLIELDKLARVHGMTRKEAQAALDAQTQDKRFKLFYAQMGSMGNETKSFMAGLQSADKEFADGMADLIMNNGIPSANNAMAMEIARTSPELTELAQKLRQGNVSQEEANKIIRKSSATAKQFESTQGVNSAMFLNLTGTIGLANASLVSLGELGSQSAVVTAEQAKAMEESKKNSANLDKALLNLRDQFMTAIQPALKLFEGMLTGGVGTLEKFITAIANSMKTFMETVGDKGLGAAIGQALGDVIKSALSALFSSPGAVAGLVGAVALLFGAAAVKQVVVQKLAELLTRDNMSRQMPAGTVDVESGKRGGGWKKTGVGLLKGGAASVVGAGASMASNYAEESGHTKTATALDIGGSALQGAGMGAMIGSVVPILGTAIGGAIGGAIGTGVGVYKNWGKMFSGDKAKPSEAKGATAATPSGTVTPDMAAAAEVATVKTADEINAIAKALQTLDYARLTVPEATIKSIDDGTLKLRSLRGEVGAMTTAFQSLNNTGLEKITAGIGRLDESFKNFNKSFAQDFMEKFKELDKKTQEALLTDLNAKMDQLNTSTRALVELAAENTSNGNKIARNTRDASGKVF